MERQAELLIGWSIVTASYAAMLTEQVLTEQVERVMARPTDEQLALTPPSGALLDRLQELDLDAADEATLVEAIAAANRVVASATAVMNRAAGVLSERDRMNSPELAAYATTPEGEDSQAGCTAADELAPRLGWTRHATRHLTRRGRTLATYLCNTATALSSGLIDAGRANALVDSLQDVSWQVAMAVEDEVLPRAPYRTAGQIRRDVAAAIIAVDPAEAHARAQARQRRRRVSRPRVLPDETAAMTIEGPAADMVGLDLALDATARAAKAGGDSRTLDQLRFDLLASQGSAALATGRWKLADGEAALANIGGRRPQVHVTVPLDQLLPAAQGAHALGSASGTQNESNDGALICNAGAGHPTRRVHNDIPADPGPAGPIEPIGTNSVSRLAGYGPISPVTARALAAGGTWRRLVTDPVTDSLLDLGHQRYRPSTALADHIRARDRTCVRPGCSTPALESQLDHTQEWRDDGTGGRTDADNLGPLCLRDHQIKTHGDFDIDQPEAGIFEWNTPAGYRYRRERDGSITTISHPRHDQPPPF